MSWVGVGAFVLNAASTAYQTNQQRRQAESAEAANQRQAEAMRQAELQDQQNFNRQNRNTADVGALLNQNTGGFGAANITGGGAGTGGATLGAGGLLGR